MKLEDQVTSLDLSKKLKELGVKQKSIFVWEYINENAYGIRYFPRAGLPNKLNNIVLYSAFTVAELGELLPRYVTQANHEYYFTQLPSKHCDKWLIFYRSSFFSWDGEDQQDESEANVRAKMLIYLIENKLIEISDLK